MNGWPVLEETGCGDDIACLGALDDGLPLGRYEVVGFRIPVSLVGLGDHYWIT